MIGQGTVWAHYHHMTLMDPDQDVELMGKSSNGVFDPQPEGGGYFHGGIHTGAIAYTWASHDVAPPLVLDGWEDVVQVPVATAGGGTLHVVGWGGESFDETDLAVAGPGRYLIRCSYTGRDLEYDDMPDDDDLARETFHLDIWPDPGNSPGILLKATSECAEHWRTPDWQVGVPKDIELHTRYVDPDIDSNEPTADCDFDEFDPDDIVSEPSAGHLMIQIIDCPDPMTHLRNRFRNPRLQGSRSIRPRPLRRPRHRGIGRRQD